MRSVRLLFVLLAVSLFSSNALLAQNAPVLEGKEEKTEAKGEEGEKEHKLDVAGEMFGHVGDSHEWHLFGVSGHPVAIPLPVIAYTPTLGLQVFSASAFNFHEMEEHVMEDGKTHISNSVNGLHLEKGIKEKLIADDGSKVYDFSITKNVLAMFLSIGILLVDNAGSRQEISEKRRGQSAERLSECIRAGYHLHPR